MLASRHSPLTNGHQAGCLFSYWGCQSLLQLASAIVHQGLSRGGGELQTERKAFCITMLRQTDLPHVEVTMSQQEQTGATLPPEEQKGERARMTQITGEITGRRWCGYHQGHADSSSGQFIERSGRRWMCRSCLVKRRLISD